MQSLHIQNILFFLSLVFSLLSGVTAKPMIALSTLPVIGMPEKAASGRPFMQEAFYRLLEEDSAIEQHTEILKALNLIDSGRKTLRLLHEYDIRIALSSGEATRYIPDRNQIVIDSSYGQETAALALIHEAVHARYHLHGTVADPRSSDRESYITAKVLEESEAISASIEAKMEFDALARKQIASRFEGDEGTRLHPVLEEIYGSAYESARLSTLAGVHELDDESVLMQARASARRSVFDALMDFKVVTSNTKQTYPYYWGSYWDDVNSQLGV